MKSLTLCFALLFAPAAFAQTVSCQGIAPDWSLEFDESQARFTLSSETRMTLRLTTNAEGQEWPRAFTLVGDNDTAIALIEQETCLALPYRGHVLTQRAQTPILFTGCCSVDESSNE